MRSDQTRPVSSAKAEVLADLARQMHDVRASWTVAGLIGMVAYFVHVPIAALLAELEFRVLLAVPLIAVGIASPFIAALVGELHAKLNARRRLPALLATTARKHGASTVELEPTLRDEVAALLHQRRP